MSKKRGKPEAGDDEDMKEEDLAGKRKLRKLNDEENAASAKKNLKQSPLKTSGVSPEMDKLKLSSQGSIAP